MPTHPCTLAEPRVGGALTRMFEAAARDDGTAARLWSIQPRRLLSGQVADLLVWCSEVGMVWVLVAVLDRCCPLRRARMGHGGRGAGNCREVFLSSGRYP